MEADLLRFYGVDLLDLGTDRLTWRRLAVLVARLPRESSLVRAIVGEPVEWSGEAQLTASVIDHLRVTNYLLGASLVGQGVVKKNPVERPAPVERPGVGRPKGRGLASLARDMGHVVM